MLCQIFFSNWCRGFLFFFIERIYIADLMSRISNLMIVEVFYSFHHKNLHFRFDIVDFYFKFDVDDFFLNFDEKNVTLSLISVSKVLFGEVHTLMTILKKSLDYHTRLLIAKLLLHESKSAFSQSDSVRSEWEYIKRLAWPRNGLIHPLRPRLWQYDEVFDYTYRFLPQLLKCLFNCWQFQRRISANVSLLEHT